MKLPGFGLMYIFAFAFVLHLYLQAGKLAILLFVSWHICTYADLCLITLLTASDLSNGRSILSPQGIHTFSLSPVGISLSMIVPSRRGSICRTQTEYHNDGGVFENRHKTDDGRLN